MFGHTGLKGIWVSALLSLLFCAAASAAVTDCVEAGGMAVCTEPIIVPTSPSVAADAESWSYGLCDEQAAYLQRAYWWCIVRGGTWDTSPPVTPQCLNEQPVFDPVIYPWSKTFEGLAHNACYTNDGLDTGWGAIVTSAYCWNGSTVYKNNIPITQFRRLGAFSGTNPIGRCDTAWAEAVTARRDRMLVCPQGYASRQKPGAPAGDIECFYLPPCCETVGNPINPAQGNKTLVEVEFRSPRRDGLSIVRYYNNAVFYKGTALGAASAPKAADFWRTDYDRRLFPIVGTPSTIASVQREDGYVQYFSPTGQQLHNIGGGANHLDKLGDGSWKYTSTFKDIELYDATGKLQSITYHTGMVHTLVYSDASTPPSIAPYPGLLIHVTDSLSRAINFTYDSQGRRSSVTDTMNQPYVYSYDGAGNLWKVTYPDLASRVYVYGEASNNCNGAVGCSYALMPWTLTGIVDENGKRYATYVYSSSGTATSSQHAGGAGRVAVVYSDNQATITDALGTVRTTIFQNVLGVMKTSSITQPCITPGCTGTVTRYFTYEPYGNLASQTDFNAKKVCYSYDTSRNLETARVEGVLTEACSTVLTTLPSRPDVRKVSTQWHSTLRLPIKVAEPLRVRTNTYNGDGGVYCAPTNVVGVLCTTTLQETTDATGQQGLGPQSPAHPEFGRIPTTATAKYSPRKIRI